MSEVKVPDWISYINENLKENWTEDDLVKIVSLVQLDTIDRCQESMKINGVDDTHPAMLDLDLMKTEIHDTALELEKMEPVLITDWAL